MNPTPITESCHRLDAYRVSLDLVRSLVARVARIRHHDRDLGEQLRRAANSTVLNIAEGGRRRGRDRLHHWRVAAGSADEVRAALEVAQAWGYLEANAAEAPLALVDRVLAMLWRLTH